MIYVDNNEPGCERIGIVCREYTIENNDSSLLVASGRGVASSESCRRHFSGDFSSICRSIRHSEKTTVIANLILIAKLVTLHK